MSLRVTACHRVVRRALWSHRGPATAERGQVVVVSAKTDVELASVAAPCLEAWGRGGSGPGARAPRRCPSRPRDVGSATDDAEVSGHPQLGHARWQLSRPGWPDDREVARGCCRSWHGDAAAAAAEDRVRPEGRAGVPADARVLPPSPTRPARARSCLPESIRSSPSSRRPRRPARRRSSRRSGCDEQPVHRQAAPTRHSGRGPGATALDGKRW